jgi:aspartate kinase
LALIVQKYGGTSVATPDHIKRVAQRIVSEKRDGHRVVVVVSAIGHTTDELIAMAHEVSQHPPEREMDMLLSVGERISIALLAMAIHDLGENAISFTGSQVGIITDNKHTEARILEVRANRLLQELDKGKIVIVAGFQGVSIDKEITTLGRGGSDTTAIALAAALKADRCEIMKDVDGIFVAEPKLIPEAKLNKEISYEEMIEMAEFGAGVLQKESIEMAKAHQIKIAVGSSETGRIGTIITDRSMDSSRIAGVVGNKGVEFITLTNLGHSETDQINTLIIDKRIKTYFHQFSRDQLYLVIKMEQAGVLSDLVSNLQEKSPRITFSRFSDLGIVSIIGTALNCSPELFETVNDILKSRDESLNLWHISPQRISWVIPEKMVDDTVKRIYQKFKIADA